MKRGILATLALSSCLLSRGWGQVGGSGTPNTIPRFITATTIGDSPIIQSGGNIGINTNFLTARLSVVEGRNTILNGFQPIAVYGNISSDMNFAAAVRGDATATTGSASGVIGVASGPGQGVTGLVLAAEGGTGVSGTTQSTSGFAVGVGGEATGSTGNGVGVFGQTFSGDGVAGLFINRRRGNILVGNVGQNPDTTVFRVDGSGRVFANGGFRPFGADFAEDVVVSGDRSRYEAGDLLVINPVDEDHLTLSATPYSTLVAGVYSTTPGVLASQHHANDLPLNNEVPLAVVGIVPCKVTAENGPIAPGDLLVTSSTVGRAMKGTDRGRMLGAVVGKALESLREGTGTIQVLVTLQ